MKLNGQFPISTDGLPEKTHANLFYTRVISGSPRDVDELCAFLGYYAVSGGNSISTFRDDLSVPSSLANITRSVM